MKSDDGTHQVYPEPGASGGPVAAEGHASGRPPLPPSSLAALARAPPPGANHYSGSTLSMRSTPSSEPIESNVRLRLGLAPPELEWRANQLHGVWVVEDEASPLGRLMAKSRAKLTARLTGRRDGRSTPSAHRCGGGSDGGGSRRSDRGVAHGSSRLRQRRRFSRACGDRAPSCKLAATAGSSHTQADSWVT
jgi:hypothetical protein